MNSPCQYSTFRRKVTRNVAVSELTLTIGGCDNSIGKATAYRLEGPGSILDGEEFFFPENLDCPFDPLSKRSSRYWDNFALNGCKAATV